MIPFKVGDRVKRFRGGTNYGSCDTHIGDTGTIVKMHSSASMDVQLDHNNGIATRCDTGNYELIESKPKMNSIKEKFLLSLMGEPKKSFYKAGITNANGELTSDGKEIFLTYLLSKFEVEFKKEVVDALLVEEK